MIEGSTDKIKDASHTTTTESTDGTTTTPTMNDPLEAQEIYQYYKESLIPAIASSLPLLFTQVKADALYYIRQSLIQLMHFLLPWTKEDFEFHAPHIHMPAILNQKWIQGNITQFIESLDKDHDGK